MQARATRRATSLVSDSEPQSAVRPWRLSRRLGRYVVRELTFPTLLSLGGLSLLAIAADLVTFSDLIINRGFRVRQVAAIALFRSVAMVSRAIPFSVLLGVFVTLGRMGSDREILALETCGVSTRRLVIPVLLFAGLFTVLGVGISVVASPWANRSLAISLAASARQSPGTLLRGGVVSRVGEWRILAKEVSSQGDQLRDVSIWVPMIHETVFAKRGAITTLANGAKQILIEDAALLRPGRDGPTYVRFDSMQQVTPYDDTAAASAANWLSSASLSELASEIRSQKELAPRREAQAEWHRRFALPMAAILLGLLAVPLSLRRRHLSRSGGVVLGLVVTLIYFALLQFSNTLVRIDGFPVSVAAWAPNLALIAAAIALIAPWRAVQPPRDRAGSKRSPTGGPVAHSHAPPRTRRFALDRYVMSRFCELGVGCLAVLVIAFLLVDVIDNLQWFTKYHSTLNEVLRFYAARLPLIVSRVVPMALLVAAALTVSLFGVTGELLGMRASGVPTLRIVLPILALCFAVGGLYLALVDQVVPHSAALASQIKRVEIKHQTTERVSVWSRQGDLLFQVQRIDPLRGVATGLTLYEIDADGLPRSRTDADTARYIGDGMWQLSNPQRIEIQPDGPRLVPTSPYTKLGEDLARERDGSQLSIGELRQEIREMEGRGYDAKVFLVDLHAKLAAPLACIVLPALALLFASGGPPFPKPSQILVVSVAVGIGYMLLSAVGTSLGYGGAVAPAVAGWGPIGALAIATVWLAARVRRLARGA